MSKATIEMLLPKLRFPEFQDSGEWQEKRLEEILSYEQPTRYLVEDTRYSDKYETPVLTAGKTFLLGYTNETKGIFKDNLPTIIFDDFTTAFQFVDFPFKAKSSAMKMLIPASDKTNMKFAFEAMKTVKFFPSTHKRYWISEYQNIKVPFPLSAEQQKIAECLSSIDDLITAHSQKFDALKAYKNGLMQQLFPAEGETVPKLRFPEFQNVGEWVECQLGKCLSRPPEYGINAPAVLYTEKLPTYLRITDISEDGNFLRSKKVSVAKKVNDNNYLCDGDIALARTGASVGKSYKYKKTDGKLVFAGFLIRVRPDREKLNTEFLFQFLSTEQYWRWVDFSSVRSGQPGINGKEYASLPVPLPTSLEEQQKIADCLSSIDNLIATQAKKTLSLKAHKAGLIQQLFPATEEVNE